MFICTFVVVPVKIFVRVCASHFFHSLSSYFDLPSNASNSLLTVRQFVSSDVDETRAETLSYFLPDGEMTTERSAI